VIPPDPFIPPPITADAISVTLKKDHAMKVQISQQGATLIARLSGQLDITDDEGFADALLEIQLLSPKSVILDFSAVAYIASQGLGILMNFHRAITRAGGKVVISHASPAIRTILQTVRLDTLMPVHENTAAAVAALN
jgi:anti-sigma B factor antagonist/stage II sporulation protein AA (anti-sigma F factor antagonist)